MFSILKMRNKCVFNSNKCLLNHLKSTPKEWFTRSLKKSIQQNDNNLSDLPNIRSLLKPFVFTVGFSGTVYTVCLVWNYESTVGFKQKFNSWNQWKESLYDFHDNQRKSSDLRNQLNEWWSTRTDAFKLFSAIAAINVLVFIGWKIPRIQPFMIKHFMTQTNNRQLRCWPMLWSTFSHSSATHLFFNLIVLLSFSQIGVKLFGTEQFTALYLSSGVVSSFGSYLAKVLAHKTAPSLGASGAILGILSSCCIARPDLELMIIFLPFFTISAGMALKGIILMDSAGLLFGWRFFDHGAHLAGALFGILYTTYGQNFVSEHKREVINIWRKIRNKII